MFVCVCVCVCTCVDLAKEHLLCFRFFVDICDTLANQNIDLEEEFPSAYTLTTTCSCTDKHVIPPSHKSSPVFSRSKAVPWAKVMLARPVAPGVGCGTRGNKLDLEISPDMSTSEQHTDRRHKVSVIIRSNTVQDSKVNRGENS